MTSAMGAGGALSTSVSSDISGGGGVDGWGTVTEAGGAGGGGVSGWAGPGGVAAGAVEGGVGGGGGAPSGAAGGVPTVQVPSAQTQPAPAGTQWPGVQMALGDGGISQCPATQTQRRFTWDQ